MFPDEMRELLVKILFGIFAITVLFLGKCAFKSSRFFFRRVRWLGTLSLLGGVAKGLSLSTPKGRVTRPTPVLLRRKLFDFRQDWWPWCFVDLCAGVGTVGLEAWSRGACWVQLVESSFRVYRHLKKNVEKVTFSHWEEVGERPLYILPRTVEHHLRGDVGDTMDRKTCWFFDPPYHRKDLYDSVFASVMGRMGERDELWIQNRRGERFSNQIQGRKIIYSG